MANVSFTSFYHYLMSIYIFEELLWLLTEGKDERFRLMYLIAIKEVLILNTNEFGQTKICKLCKSTDELTVYII